MQDYIHLTSIDSKRNRNRAYAITLTIAQRVCDIYIVRQSWGRGDFYKRAKQTYFEDFGEVQKYIEGLLKLRSRHGYKMVAKSEDFPNSAVPSALALDPCVVQLSLFPNQIAA